MCGIAQWARLLQNLPNIRYHNFIIPCGHPDHADLSEMAQSGAARIILLVKKFPCLSKPRYTALRGKKHFVPFSLLLDYL
jgi:hypothetical protein